MPDVDATTQVNVLRELLAEVHNRTAEVEAKLADLHAERHGLELALARLAGTAEYGGSTAHPRLITSEPEKWRILGKTEAVQRVLAEATKPLGPADIVKALGSVGLPQEDSESVRGALAYLKRKGKAIFIGRSQWVLVNGAVHQRLRQTGQTGEVGTTYVESAPAGAGADSTPIHPIRKEGDASGTGYDRVHDGNSSWQADHRVHDHGRAPIVRGT